MDADTPSAGSPVPAEVDRLLPLVYSELRRLARGFMRGERASHTLQPTALVHEAYLRLADVERIDWQGKTHFFAFAATQMRRILVEHARAAGRVKRGANAVRVELDESLTLSDELAFDLLAIDEGLQRLARASPRQSRIAELRLFAGMSVAECAAAVGVSERTVKQDWRVARAWLSRWLRPDGQGGP